MAEKISVVIGNVAHGDIETTVGSLAKAIYTVTSTAASVEGVHIAIIENAGHGQAIPAGEVAAPQIGVAVIRWTSGA